MAECTKGVARYELCAANSARERQMHDDEHRVHDRKSHFHDGELVFHDRETLSTAAEMKFTAVKINFTTVKIVFTFVDFQSARALSPRGETLKNEKDVSAKSENGTVRCRRA